ncbi:MAG: hypothetical protein LC122_12000 [Chitinophagales bacterium]|nr:hypothetical protein [Chitinophagales bacterium]
MKKLFIVSALVAAVVGCSDYSDNSVNDFAMQGGAPSIEVQGKGGGTCPNTYGVPCTRLFYTKNNCDASGHTTSLTYVCYNNDGTTFSPPPVVPPTNCNVCREFQDNLPHCNEQETPSEGGGTWVCSAN